MDGAEWSLVILQAMRISNSVVLTGGMKMCFYTFCSMEREM
jgi:hypothetical protein